MKLFGRERQLVKKWEEASETTAGAVYDWNWVPGLDGQNWNVCGVEDDWIQLNNLNDGGLDGQNDENSGEFHGANDCLLCDSIAVNSDYSVVVYRVIQSFLLLFD